MVITKIEAQKKSTPNIYLADACVWCRRGNGASLLCSEGPELTKEQIEEIKHDDCIQQALILHFLILKLVLRRKSMKS